MPSDTQSVRQRNNASSSSTNATNPEPEVEDPLSNLKTIFDPSTCTRKGLCPVTKLRHQEEDSLGTESHSLYFEQHGKGKEKIVFIMGCVVILIVCTEW